MDQSSTLPRPIFAPASEANRRRHRSDRVPGSTAADTAPDVAGAATTKKQVVVAASVFEQLRELQRGSSPRIDLMYWATGALQYALSHETANDDIRRIAVGLLRNDLEQPS